MLLPKEFQNPPKLLELLRERDENYWIKRGETMALNLFHEMSKRVPAYKDFLKRNKINPSTIKTIEEFKQLPTLDKQSYLTQYSFKDLSWDGEFKNKRWVVSTTSGSTGEPFYFPRESDQDWQYAALAELYLLSNFDIANKSTLYVVGFPMGPWIGGLFTYQAIKYVAERGDYNISIITPGINKQDIINAIKKLGPSFDQVILGSYGPFMKDALDDGIRLGVDWKKYNMKLICSAEVFSETFRDYITKKTGINNPYLHTLNHYGTVDLGTMANETPISILARRLSLKHKRLYKALFGDISKLPTLAQYFPELFYFEEQNENLLCSAYSGIPLVRYDLKDHGGVITLTNLKNKFKEYGINIEKEASNWGLKSSIWNIPLVYVYERSDFSVSFYAACVYPEPVRKALQENSLSKYLTGKFTMLVKFNANNNQYLEINIELKPTVQSNKKLRDKVKSIVLKTLLRDSSEYRKIYQEIQKRAIPKFVYWPYEHPTYFKPGTKQKWVKK